MRNLFLFVLIVIFCDNTLGMTRAQLKKTLSIVKKQCLNKIGVADDKVNKIDQGVFIEDPKVMCYIACVFKMLQVVKNDKVQADLMTKQIDVLFPEDMRAAVKKGVQLCMPLQDNYSDMCEGIFYATKCFYEADPENFVFA